MEMESPVRFSAASNNNNNNNGNKTHNTHTTTNNNNGGTSNTTITPKKKEVKSSPYIAAKRTGLTARILGRNKCTTVNGDHVGAAAAASKRPLESGVDDRNERTKDDDDDVVDEVTDAVVLCEPVTKKIKVVKQQEQEGVVSPRGRAMKCCVCITRQALKTCIMQACLKCCSDLTCAGHSLRRAKNDNNSKLLAGEHEFTVEAERIRKLAVIPGSMYEPSFHYLGETMTLWCLSDFMLVKKWRTDAVRRSKRNINLLGSSGGSSSSTTTRTRRKRRFQMKMEELYQSSLDKLVVESSKFKKLVDDEGPTSTTTTTNNNKLRNKCMVKDPSLVDTTTAISTTSDSRKSDKNECSLIARLQLLRR